MSKNPTSFEENLKELESLVSKLESGGLTLEESLDKFEKGITLYKDCKAKLQSAEKRINRFKEALEFKTHSKADLVKITRVLKTYEELDKIKDIKKLNTLAHITAEYSPDAFFRY